MYFHRKIKHIGFISTRFYGTDGVSLETDKWDEVLKGMGYETFFFAGLSDKPAEKTRIDELAYLYDPRILSIQERCFGTFVRAREITIKIQEAAKGLKESIYDFIEHFGIDLVIVENALSIPLNIPLGIALTECIAETGLPVIGHHHDFHWERQRFIVNCVNDYIKMAFPPSLPSIQHVVINSQALKDLSYRRGLNAELIPNVFDFSREPPSIDDFNSTLREDLGLKGDDIFILQPTRVIARKGIEHSIELVARLKNRKAKLVITHQTKDEGKEYLERVISYAKLLDVELVIRPDIIDGKRGYDPNGRKIYSIWDLYIHADFVTYPSLYEGFGNAFLEAVYFRKVLLVNRYSIYERDIEHLGFKTITMETFINDGIVEQVKDVLANKATRAEMTKKNFDLGKRYFSYDTLRHGLKTILLFFEGC